MGATTTQETEQETERLRALFQRVVDGDDRAFRELYDEVSRPLLAYCLSFTRDMDDARDLFQQTMLAVYEHRHRYHDGNLLGWIFTISRNAGRSLERRARRYDVLDGDPLVEPGRDPLETAEETQLVQAAILELPEEFRTVILLRYFGELSIREIAESEGISESLAKVRLFRARERLSVILGPLIGPES